MPIYEYECGACGGRHEFIQKFDEAPKRKCPACGKSKLKKLVSAAAFHLKGGGWYVTDFRDKDKKKKGNGADKKDGEAKESGKESKSESAKSSEKKSDKSSSTSSGTTSSD